MSQVLAQSATTCVECGRALAASRLDYFDTRFGHNDDYAVVACAYCGLLQTFPRPSVERISGLYEQFYNFGGESDTAYTRWREAFLTSFIYRLWLAIDGDISFHACSGKGLLLDYGCNEGRGLALYRKNGFEVEGLELNPKAAVSARAKGFKVASESLDTFRPARPYDVVVLSNVLEHAINPRQMLAQIRRLLPVHGQVWISCPNNRSWLRMVFGRYWINWHVPFHIVHFDETSLSNLLTQNGFQIVEKKQRTPALWVAQSFVSRLFSKKGNQNRWMRKTALIAALVLIIRGILFPLLWLGNLLGHGDCLIIIAKNNDVDNYL